MTTGKTIDLTRRAFVGKVMSLLLNVLFRLVITKAPTPGQRGSDDALSTRPGGEAPTAPLQAALSLAGSTYLPSMSAGVRVQLG